MYRDPRDWNHFGPGPGYTSPTPPPRLTDSQIQTIQRQNSKAAAADDPVTFDYPIAEAGWFERVMGWPQARKAA